MPQMQWASASATEPVLKDAVASAADRLLKALGGSDPDLVVVFASKHHAASFITLPALLRREFDSAQLIGCLGVHVIGNNRELEGEAAVTLVGAVLPDVKLQAVHLSNATTPPTYAERSLWASALHIGDEQPECMLVLAEPFSLNPEPILKGLDRHFPNTCKLGGLASGMEQPGANCLLLNERTYDAGCVMLSMSGDISVDTIVAQGCRPIGDPMFANATHENLILELDGKMPREVLTELYRRIKRSDRKLFTDALFIGLAMEPQRDQYQAGDFLIRTILGLDPDSGALLVNTHVPAHSVVQLHLRDALTSAQDLELLLTQYRSQHNSKQIKGGLLFSCLGRGSEFYGHADHDRNALKQHLGDVPLGGFFCNGELGPVRGASYMHGYTSVFALFKSKN